MERTRISDEVIKVNLELRGIGRGKSEGISNALVRPYRVLINEERKVGRITYVFYQENEESFKIFGSFCYAPSGRLLFFPGIKKRKILWDSFDFTRSMPFKELDHFTLEPNWKSWHVTTLEKYKEKDKWIPSRELLEIQQGIFFWFGLSVQTPLELEEVPEKTTWDFRTSDSSRAEEIFNESRDKAIWNILRLPPGSQLKERNYLHFDVFLATQKPLSTDFKVMAPLDKPALKRKTEDKKIPARIHKVKIINFNAYIYVITSCVPGILSEPIIVTTHKTNLKW